MFFEITDSSNYPPTNEQLEIIESASKHNVLKINAFAGTGKTSTLQQIAKKYHNKSFLYLAYNKSIQQDAIKKFEKNVEVRTIHSLAYKYVASSTKLDLNNIRNHSIKDFQTMFNTTAAESREIMHMFTAYCNSSDIKTNSKLINSIILNLENYNISISFDYILKKFQLLLTMGLVTKKFDYIMLDEAQDSNEVTLDILSKLNADHKLIVGDKHQQIYSFKKSANIMNQLNAHQLPLTQTFRFPKKIATISNLLLARYKNENLKILSTRDELDFDIILQDKTKSIGYLSRGNATLISTMQELSERNTPYQTIRHPKEIFITIKDIGYFFNDIKELISEQNSFLKYLKNTDALIRYMKDARDRQLESFYRVFIVSFQSDLKRVISLEKEAIEYFNSSDAFRFFLTTAHTVKGLEFDGIEVADDFFDFGCILYEMGYRTYDEFLHDENKSNHPLLDEINLLYVAITRCKLGYIILSENIKYINDKNWKQNINDRLIFLNETKGCFLKQSQIPSSLTINSITTHKTKIDDRLFLKTPLKTDRTSKTKPLEIQAISNTQDLLSAKEKVSQIGNTIIVLDFETNTRTPMDVLEVGALKVVLDEGKYKILDIFHRYYFSKYETNFFALYVHSLDSERINKLRNGVTYPRHFDEDREFLAFCSDSSTLVAHNVSFELFCLNQVIVFENIFCTMKENKKILKLLDIRGYLKNPKLTEVCKHYNIELDYKKYHSAIYDARLTLSVLNSMNNQFNNFNIIEHTLQNKIAEKIEAKNKKEQIKKIKTDKKAQHEKEKLERKIQKAKQREILLNNLKCPYCSGQNIHKKDKRERKNYVVQRYMCMDCIKIFQQKI